MQRDRGRQRDAAVAPREHGDLLRARTLARFITHVYARVCTGVADVWATPSNIRMSTCMREHARAQILASTRVRIHLPAHVVPLRHIIRGRT